MKPGWRPAGPSHGGRSKRPSHCDGEAVSSGGGVDVNAGGLHRGASLVGMEAVLQVAFVAEAARAAAESEGLVVAGEEGLSL